MSRLALTLIFVDGRPCLGWRDRATGELLSISAPLFRCWRRSTYRRASELL